MKFVALLVILFCSITIVFAQENQAVYAKVTNSKTGDPVPFATVKIMKGDVLIGGVISNEDGDFQIPLKYSSDMNSIIVICIGYSTMEMRSTELDKDKVNIIKLKEASLQLKEVVVSSGKKKKLTANKIVQLAVNNIPKNYPVHPYSYLAYYRDYQKEDKEYVNLNEAIVGVFDNGFKDDDYQSTKIKLYQYKTNSNFRRDSMTAIAYDNNNFGGSKFIPTATVSSFGGNELSILRIHDALRNNNTTSFSFVNVFKSDFVKNHSFELLDTVYLDDIPLYHISFESFYFATGAKHFAKGEIFIEYNNYAIHKLVYSTYLRQARKEELLYKIQIEYARANSLMFLNYISFNNFFQSKTHDEFKVNDVVYDRAINAFVVTFNHVPQKQTALEKKNYDFRFDKQPMLITDIQLSENNDKEVYVFIGNAKDYNLKDKPKVLAEKFESKFKHIRDSPGNTINEIKYKLISQFRELFTQKIDSSRQLSRGLFIAKDMPLKNNKSDTMELKNVSNYWMNTPLTSSPDWIVQQHTEVLVFDSAYQKNNTHALSEKIPAPEITTSDKNNILWLQEKAYLQTDKPYYYPGEKIWFKAYLIYRTPMLMDSLSKVLYVELINPEGKVELSRTLPIENGMAFGDMNLSGVVMPGNYFLRAYTNWMLNYGDANIFMKPIAVFNLFEQPDAMPMDSTRGPISPQLKLSTSKVTYKPKEEIILEIELKDEEGRPMEGNFSVAVTDASQVTPVPEKNIMESYPFISSKILVKEDSALYPVESGISVQGIYKNKNAKTLKAKLMVIQLREKKLENFLSVDTDMKGKFWVTGLQFYDSADVGLKVDNGKRQTGKIEILPRDIPPVLNLETEIFPKTKTKTENQRPELANRLVDNATILKEVIVEIDQIKENPSNPIYGRADFSINSNVISKYNYVSDVLQRIPGFAAMNLSSLSPGGQLVVIDGVRFGGDGTRAGLDALDNLSPSSVERIDVYKYGSAAIFGSAGASGVIVVQTKQSHYESDKKIPGAIDQSTFQIYHIKGYSPVDNFTMPDYSIPNNSSNGDYRSTVLWKPQVATGNDGKAKVHFYAADLPAYYRIIVEGVTSTLMPVRNIIFVEVRSSN